MDTQVALRASQSRWHEGEHDLTPWTLYLMRVLEDAYRDVEARALPDISQATIRDALEELRGEGHLSSGRGRHAMWERAGAEG